VALALALAGLLFIFLWWFTRTPPERVARLLRRGGLVLVAVIVIYLAATGRLHWLFALIGALIPFAMRLLRLFQFLPWPLLQRLIAGLQRRGAGASPSAGRQSRVRTRYLDMILDHDTGAMDGQVLAGRYRDSKLSAMNLQDLIALLDECQTDAQSVAVLQAYLDRAHPDWRDSVGPREQAHAGNGQSGAMTVEEAYDILGLQPGASREEIVATHRRLMQKLHPDHGGSDYLAAMINRAKDILLGK